MNFGPESIFAWKQYQINNAVNTKSPRWEVNRRLRGHLGVCPGYCYRHLISCYLLTTTYYGNIRHSRLSREHGKVGATYEKSWQIFRIISIVIHGGAGEAARHQHNAMSGNLKSASGTQTTGEQLWAEEIWSRPVRTTRLRMLTGTKFETLEMFTAN